MLARLAGAFVIAFAISFTARRARALSRSGAVAATVIGTLALVAGWRWGVLLVTYFVTASILSHFAAPEKQARTAGVIEKGGEREATQVLANGAVFAVAAALTILDSAHGVRWFALGAGALAASLSDTCATEIGTLAGEVPRSIFGSRPLPRGMSGGVTLVGTLAALGGAAFMAIVVRAFGWPARIALATLIAGFVGSTLDSLLGATVQARRWCERCQSVTERSVHDCGAPTRHSGGVAWLGNDAVNLASVLVSGLLAMSLAG